MIRHRNNETDTTICLMEIEPVTWYVKTSEGFDKAEKKQQIGTHKKNEQLRTVKVWLYWNFVASPQKKKEFWKKITHTHQIKDNGIFNCIELKFCEQALYFLNRHTGPIMHLAHPWFVTTPMVIISVHSIVHMCSTRAVSVCPCFSISVGHNRKAKGT